MLSVAKILFIYISGDYSYNITVVSPSKEKIYSETLDFAYTFDEEGEYQVITTINHKNTIIERIVELAFSFRHLPSETSKIYRTSVYYLPKS